MICTLIEIKGRARRAKLNAVSVLLLLLLNLLLHNLSQLMHRILIETAKMGAVEAILHIP